METSFEESIIRSPPESSSPLELTAGLPFSSARYETDWLMPGRMMVGRIFSSAVVFAPFLPEKSLGDFSISFAASSRLLTERTAEPSPRVMTESPELRTYAAARIPAPATENTIVSESKIAITRFLLVVIGIILLEIFIQHT